LFGEAHVSIEVKTSMGTKAKSPGEKRPFLESVGGSFPRGDSAGKWVQKTQVVDRRNNRYIKRVVDEETGEVLRDVDYPLTDHVSHGDARPKPHEEPAIGPTRDQD
jgi:hypothetical protein